VFHLNATLITTHGPLYAQNIETNGNIKYLQPYPIVTTDALREIGMAIIAVVLLLGDYLLQANTSFY
jgi:hypothetical protein